MVRNLDQWRPTFIFAVIEIVRLFESLKSWTRFDMVEICSACHAGGRGFKSRLSRHHRAIRPRLLPRLMVLQAQIVSCPP
jgi:hypothetical protein